VAIYEVEEDLLLREMRRFVREEIDFISKVKEFVRSAGGKSVRLGRVLTSIKDADSRAGAEHDTLTPSLTASLGSGTDILRISPNVRFTP